MKDKKNIWLHRYAIFTVICTAVLLYWGGLVTSTGSGLAVPDWPLSYGMLMPPMVGGIFYEHGHRMVATFVGLLTIILALWIWRKDDRTWMRYLGFIALGMVIVQGVLGGITVLFFLPLSISVMHATLAQTFFCTTVAIALFTSPWWRNSGRHKLKSRSSYSLRHLSLIFVILIYCQLIIGAIMRHLDAGLAIPDFPLAFGKIIPPFESVEIMIHFLHRFGALIIAIATIWLTFHIFKYYKSVKSFLFPLISILLLVVLQISLGALIILGERMVFPTTLHLVTGALILGFAVLLALQTHKIVKPAIKTGKMIKHHEALETSNLN